VGEFRVVVTILALLFAMFLAGVHGIRHRIGVVILGLLSVIWFTVDRLFEGKTIVAINRSMGFTTADIVGVLGLVVTGALAWRWRVAPSVHGEETTEAEYSSSGIGTTGD
jgi:hypothetical protein